MKLRKRILAIILILTFIFTLSDINSIMTKATAVNGIYGNGTQEISININASPYTDMAKVPDFGQWAYTSSGCAWFATSRAKELTNKNITTIYAGKSWYDSAWNSFGFSRGISLPATEKALACYNNHVSVVEKVVGDTVYISEGGYNEAAYASYGYCRIAAVSKSYLIASTTNGGFIGFVYLGVSQGYNPESGNPGNTGTNPDSVIGKNVYYGSYIQDMVTDEEDIKVLKSQNFSDDKLYIQGIHFAKKDKNYYQEAPIQWQILAEDEESYMLLSKKILLNRDFGGENFWDSADIRTWLNGDFYNEAFSNDEKGNILTTTLRTLNWPYEDRYINGKDAHYEITHDNVYLLDYNDVQNTSYGFANETGKSVGRVAYTSQYVDANEPAARWWIRGPAIWNYGVLQERYVTAEGELWSWYGTYSYGVRPVIRVKKAAVSFSIPEKKRLQREEIQGSDSEKAESLLTVSGARLFSNDSSRDKTQNGVYQYDGYIQTMLVDTIKAEYPYYKVTFRTNEKLADSTEILNFQPFNLEWEGWDSNIITIGDAVYNEETDEYTAYIVIQDICNSLSSGTLQGINLGFCNKEPVITLTGFYQSSSKPTMAQQEEVKTSTPSAIDESSNPIKQKVDRVTEKKPSKPGKVKITFCKSKRKETVKIKWKKAAKSEGYEVQYSKRHNFARGKKETAYRKSKILYNLKSKKTYYIRVRAYVYGNSATNYREVYGNWSKVKKVKVK